MSSPFVRRSATITAGAAVFAGLVTAPVAAFAADPASIVGIPDTAVTAIDDPDGAGTLYTLTENVRTSTTITMPNEATLDGDGHSITAVEDPDHPNFPGAVIASAVGDASGPAELDVRTLDIKTEGFQNGANSGGQLGGIYMYRAGGSLTDVWVDGISHGNGVQEGNAISIRNRVSGDDINVPRARVTLDTVEVTNYQKTGLLLDGNLSFTVKNAKVGQGAGPQGLPNPTIAANSLQISRGASGSVVDSTFALNSHEQAAGVLLYNARKVDFDGVTVSGDAPATVGINVSNNSNTIDTTFSMRGGSVTGTTTAADGVGVAVSGNPGSVVATLTDTTVTGWSRGTEGDIAEFTTSAPPVLTTVDVTGECTVTTPRINRLRIKLAAAELGTNEVEGAVLRWTIKVDGKRVETIRQHAGDTAFSVQRFKAGTGTHSVKVLKNGVSQNTYKVDTA
jgi:hypothetical protein